MEWRGTLPVSRTSVLDSLGVAAGAAVALVLGIGLAVGFGVGLYALGYLAPHAYVAIAIAPVLGWLGFVRARRDRALAAPSAETEVVATRGRVRAHRGGAP